MKNETQRVNLPGIVRDGNRSDSEGFPPARTAKSFQHRTNESGRFRLPPL